METRTKVWYAIFGFVVTALISGLFVAPCGPGCNWPVFAIMTVYAVALLFFSDAAVRVTGMILALLSIGLLAHEIYLGNRFHKRAAEMKTKRIEDMRQRIPAAGDDRLEDGASGRR